MTENIYNICLQENKDFEDKFRNQIYNEINDSYCYVWYRITGGKLYYYYGIHHGDPKLHGIDYIGSGTKFINMFNNTQREQWIFEIIGIGTWDEMNLLETYYVPVERLEDPRILNLKEGGRQGRHSDETKEKIGE